VKQLLLDGFASMEQLDNDYISLYGWYLFGSLATMCHLFRIVVVVRSPSHESFALASVNTYIHTSIQYLHHG
jgi:hypothetical protein